MKLETMREQVGNVAQRWRNQYGKASNNSADKQDIQRKLDALDVETATDTDVAAAIGNSFWVKSPECDECGLMTWDALEFGDPLDCERGNATICIDCLRKAVALLGRAKS